MVLGHSMVSVPWHIYRILSNHYPEIGKGHILDMLDQRQVLTYCGVKDKRRCEGLVPSDLPLVMQDR